MLSAKTIAEMNEFCKSREINTEENDTLALIKRMGDEAAKILKHVADINSRIEQCLTECAIAEGSYSFSINLGGGLEVGHEGHSNHMPEKVETPISSAVVETKEVPKSMDSAVVKTKWPTAEELQAMRSSGIDKVILKMEQSGMDVSAIKAEPNIKKQKKCIIALLYPTVNTQENVTALKDTDKKKVKIVDPEEEISDEATDEVNEVFEEMDLEDMADDLEEQEAIVPESNAKTKTEEDFDEEFDEDIATEEESQEIDEIEDLEEELDDIEEEYVPEDDESADDSLDDELDMFEDAEEIEEKKPAAKDVAPQKKESISQQLKLKKRAVASLTFAEKMQAAKEFGMDMGKVKRMNETELLKQLTAKLIVKK